MRAYNDRLDPFTDTMESVSVTNELHRIPTVGDPVIKLREVPLKADPSTLTMRVRDILIAAITTTDGTDVVIASEEWYVANDVIIIDSEKMQVTNITGNTLTVTRAYGGTTATTHTVDTPVYIDGSMEEVNSAPTAGQFYPDYSTGADGDENYNGGQILFNSADAGKIVAVNYDKTGAQADDRVVRVSLPDHIIEGLTIATGAALVPIIKAGKAWISNELVELAEDFPLTVQARRAQICYLDTNGIPAKQNAAIPVADTGTVCRWDLSNWDGVSQIPSTVGNNPLIPNGTLTREVGWHGDYGIKSNGTTGHLASTNSAGFPTGANPFHIVCLARIGALDGLRPLFQFGNYASNQCCIIRLDVAGKVYVNNWSADTYINFIANAGGICQFDTLYDGTTIYFCVNGRPVFQIANTFNITAASFLINAGAGGIGNHTVYYAEIRNALRTAAQIATASNSLLLPYRYYPDPAKLAYTDIRAILPANTHPIGFVLTDENEVVEQDDRSYKYGRREQLTEGNRLEFLGWQYYSGTGPVEWPSPFDTRKVTAVYKWAEDADGRNECDVVINAIEDADYGVKLSPAGSTPFRIIVSSTGAAYVDGVWKPSGYLGCYGRVIGNE